MFGVLLGLLGVLLGAVLFAFGVAGHGAGAGVLVVLGMLSVFFSLLLAGRSRGGGAQHGAHH